MLRPFARPALLVVVALTAALSVACSDDLGSTSVDAGTTGPAAPAVEAASTERVRVPRTGGEIAAVADVRLSAEGGYDRFVIELTDDSDLPGIDVRYADPPFEGDDGAPVAVTGETFLEVELTDARPYAGPGTLRGRTVVQQAVRTRTEDGTVVWVLGLPDKRPFAMTTEVDPKMIVIEVVRD